MKKKKKNKIQRSKYIQVKCKQNLNMKTKIIVKCKQTANKLFKIKNKIVHRVLSGN